MLRRALAALIAAGLIAALMLSWPPQPTRAQWSDPAFFAATASTGTWSTPSGLGQVWIETIQGGTWMSSGYYGFGIQLRNNDTMSATLPVEPITEMTLTITMPLSYVDDVEPVIIANAGGTSPTVGGVQSTPTWTAGPATDRGNGMVDYELTWAGSVAGQGLVDVVFLIDARDSGPVTPYEFTVQATGSPTTGFVHVRDATLY